MSLLYRAWRSGQPAPSFDRGDNDAFERKIAAIGGYHADNLRGKDAFPDLAKRHFTGLLAQGPKNAEGLVAILEAFFGARVRLQQFVGCWLELEPDDRWQLGVPARLGRTTWNRERVWTRSAKFRKYSMARLPTAMFAGLVKVLRTPPAALPVEPDPNWLFSKRMPRTAWSAAR